MSAEVTKAMEEATLDLWEHVKTLNKDSQEYDQAVTNGIAMSESLRKAENEKAEQIRKDKERIQSIKEWEAEQAHKTDELAENHAQFMIKTVVDSLLKIGDNLIFIDTVDRDLFFEEHGSHSTKVGQMLWQRLKGLGKK